MYKFKFIDFDKNINKCAASDFYDKNTLFLSPTKAASQDLKKNFQQLVSFNNFQILTMEDFKLLCLEVDTPILKEEKRTLAFFASISDFHSDFHLNSYFQSVKFAYDFFAFWDELAEELISIEAVADVINLRQSKENWQMKTFDLLQQMKDAYYQYITSRNFTDLIFIKNKENLITNWLDCYDQIVVINQFYFTELEKFLLPEDFTTIYLQLPDNIYDKSNLTCHKEFNASHLTKSRTFKLYNHLLTDEMSLRQSLFADLLNDPPDLIVDFGLLQDHLKSYKCRHLLTGTAIDLMFSSSIFQFYEQLYSLLASIILVEKHFLIPLNTLIKAFTDPRFYFPLCKDCLSTQNKDFIQINEKILNYMYDLAERDYKYLELDDPSIRNSDHDIQSLFSFLSQLLNNFAGISSASSFVKLLYSPSSISAQDILQPEELQFTDLLDTWDNLLTDFASLDEIGFLADWNDIFPNQNSHKYDQGAHFLKLFLEFAKTKPFRYSTQDADPVILTSLHNTRNIQYDNVFIADTIEGNLPPARKTPFLLTESQRKGLGLKTYEDILLREKYYFFRLIAQAKNVHCYTRFNLNERTEVSSFLEEFKIYFPDLYKQEEKPKSFQPYILCSSWLAPDEPGCALQSIPQDFFRIPFDQNSDLHENSFILGPSNVQNLLDNPFMYYLSNMLHLKKRELEYKMDYSHLLIGNLVHEAFNEMWLRIVDLKSAANRQQPFQYNQEQYANCAVDHLQMTSNNARLQKPYNYSDRYFNRIIKPLIIDAIKYFLQICDEKYSGKSINIIPEIPGSVFSLRLFDIDNISITLKGRADLRIEFVDSGQKHIYDYKSTKSKDYYSNQYNTQLLCYEHLYYHQQENVNSWLYFTTDQKLIEKKTFKHKTPSEFWQQKIDETKEIIEQVFTSGFALGNKIAYDEDDNLTRRSLAKQLRII